MSLEARLRIAIAALVALVVIAMSALYLYDFTRMTFQTASQRAGLVADQVQGSLLDVLNRETAARGLHPTSFDEWKKTWTDLIQRDPDITGMLTRTLGNADQVVAILVTDESGAILASSNPKQVNTTRGPGDDFQNVLAANWLVNLWDLMMRSEDFTTTRPLGAEGSSRVLFKVKVVTKSDLIRHDVLPVLKNLALAFSGALFIAIFLGSVLPNLFLDPLERLGRNIDLIRAGQFDTKTLRVRRESREFAAVQSKLTLLGEQFKGARELRSNVEQLLQRLEETVLLFDNAGKLVVSGETAERMLGRPRAEMVGRGLDELFPPSTALGSVIGNAVRSRQSVRDQRITMAGAGAGTRLLVSVEILRKDGGQEDLGTLITLRDIESRRQLERQIDVSSRLAAISRLTGRVAHEIKNPLNAMALHLEVLRGKLHGEQPEVDVIAGEIKRLDTVVKTFLNFNKPIDLKAQPLDLKQVVEQVLALVSIDAEAKHIRIETALEDRLWINGDADLLKQAVLNVVNNGLEALQEGGKLSLCTEWNGLECQLTVADDGPGIAPEVRDQIFNLYFTTKQQGTGIGLATTYRVVQLHGGTIDFASELGKGTTFRLRFPGIADFHGEAATSATNST
ncbi:MAG TPA: ATP-binding protein [Bryobacteraceae bacterium]